MKELLQFLDIIYPLSPALREHLEKIITFKKLHRREYILKAGQVCSHIYFISRGILRCYYEKDDTDVCSWFMKEGDVIVSIESFYRQVPGYEFIQALEDCELWYISYDDLQYCYKHFSEFNVTGRVLLEKYYIMSEQRLFAMRMQTAQQRYEYLLAHSSDLLLRVPSCDLASFMGITKETLSRIRSKKWLT